MFSSQAEAARRTKGKNVSGKTGKPAFHMEIPLTGDLAVLAGEFMDPKKLHVWRTILL